MVSLETIRAPLFVPADRPERFAKAAASEADAVILDLEDAVARAAKDTARAMLRTDFTDKPVVVRVNAAGTPWHAGDIAAARHLHVAAVIVPKAEDPMTLGAICTGLGPGVAVMALIESGLGLARAREIAALPGIARLIFGSIDFCADLGCEHRREILLPARMELVLAARLAGKPAPIDGVTAQFGDPAETYADANHARALGMSGKLCIHPRQVPQVRRAFAPSAAQTDWARRVLASGDGAVSVDGEMIDEPVRRRARSILAETTEA
ncbi:MAG: CoA ester lyase [Paracoccaceae bacterium]|jgi:citrate lyase subunit beta/citryl-CoA lyase|nr:CoA ester lyase [Paracoccaceae bacterium]